MRPTFGTKAETLARLAAEGFEAPPMMYFEARRWRDAPGEVLAEIVRFVEGRPWKLAVRSSAAAEDGAESSMAGAFKSVLNVDAADEAALAGAIGEVASAYRGGEGDQILIQPMVENVAAAGVIMTRPVSDGSPYYVINYDDVSGRTDTITGGVGAGKSVSIYKGVRDEDFDSPRLRDMLALARDLEQVYPGVPLDIEFCIDRDNRVYVLQVRRICSGKGWKAKVAREVSRRIACVEEYVESAMRPRPGLFGARTIFGVMPDWNPAEIIGVVPRPLALSLYRRLVTRRNWRLARERMGYRRLPDADLMVSIAGRPYIDVRASFNSFLPQGAGDAVGHALVDAWLERLDAHPELHDKVEFEIVPTVLEFDFDSTFRDRYPGVLGSSQLGSYRDALRGLTAAALAGRGEGALDLALAETALLESRYGVMRASPPAATPFEAASAVAAHLEECRALGTLPFAVAARHAFIAEALLRSAVRRGALAPERLEAFKLSVRTVSGSLTEDFGRVLSGALDRETFLARYGRLRPGAYDILAPRYAARPDLFDQAATRLELREPEPFAPSDAERRDLESLLGEAGLGDITAKSLFDYAAKAVAGREYAKFVFTKPLSDALEDLAIWGRCFGLSREDVSLLPVEEVIDALYAPAPAEAQAHYQARIKTQRDIYALARSFKLSYLIRTTRDVYIVPQHRSAPNFITSRRIEAPVARLDAAGRAEGALRGAVVCIESADPGYDWIFTRGIGGLVTKYGGTNSHMAIRCAEYGLPAAIGCGELLFERIASAGRCLLDCAGGVLAPLDGEARRT